MNNLIKTKLQARLLNLAKGKAPTTDSWGTDNVFINLPTCDWKNPVTKCPIGWNPIMKFEGTAGLILVDSTETDINKLELLELIAVINKPLVFELDETVPIDKLDINFTWQFRKQKEVMDTTYLYTHLEGNLQGNLYRKE